MEDGPSENMGTWVGWVAETQREQRKKEIDMNIKLCHILPFSEIILKYYLFAVCTLFVQHVDDMKIPKEAS